jgi:hypothetical protein
VSYPDRVLGGAGPITDMSAVGGPAAGGPCKGLIDGHDLVATRDRVVPQSLVRSSRTVVSRRRRCSRSTVAPAGRGIRANSGNRQLQQTPWSQRLARGTAYALPVWASGLTRCLRLCP